MRDARHGAGVWMGRGCLQTERLGNSVRGKASGPRGSRNQHPDENPEAQQNGDSTPPEKGPLLLFRHDPPPWNKDTQNKLDLADPFRFPEALFLINTDIYKTK